MNRGQGSNHTARGRFPHSRGGSGSSNRGRGNAQKVWVPRTGDGSTLPRSSEEAAPVLASDSSGRKNRISQNERAPEQKSLNVPNSENQKGWQTNFMDNKISYKEKLQDEKKSSSVHNDFPQGVNSACQLDGTGLSFKFKNIGRPSNEKASHIVADNGGSVQEEKSFDICTANEDSPVMLKRSLLEKNREKRNEMKRSVEGKKEHMLRSGMVLLKNYVSFDDQIRVIKICRELGIGSGGFYQPGYRDGAKLHLKMMCLGKNWDPERNEYGENRRSDGSKPPMIPEEFSELVGKAIKDAQHLFEKTIKACKVEEILPSMAPDICLVNFYSSTGRLGLHQDRDESPESLRKGLPVVSFSFGDSAEFLYGDQRDIEKAGKVILESGDVLIFGGKSRHIFHGVSSILPNSAPKTVLEETRLKPGRLNLTFRQY